MIRRMSTFADDYCISESLVKDEIHLSEYWPEYSSNVHRDYYSIKPTISNSDTDDSIDSVDAALHELIGEHTYEKLNGIDREQLRSIAIICQQAVSLREANSKTYGKTSGALCHLLKNKYGLRFSAQSKLFHLERIDFLSE